MSIRRLFKWTAPLTLVFGGALVGHAQTQATPAGYAGYAMSDSCDSCGPSCESGCADPCAAACPTGWCNLGDPFELFGTHSCSGIKVAGWTQVGYTTYSTGQFNNHPYSVDLNQAYLFAEKVADGSKGLDWGFRMDYVYGSDGPDTQAFANRPNTFDVNWDHGNFYGHAIPQLYGEVAFNNTSLKVGHFYTIIGYEVVTAPDNFFYSHAYTMYNSEPFTHTGALVTHQLNDEVTVWGGWSAGWDTGFDKVNGDIFLGGFSLALSDNVTFTYATTFGKAGGFGTEDRDGYSHSLVFDVTLTDRLNYVLQSDLTDMSGNNTTQSDVGVNQYLFYTINDCLAAGVRAEWWNSKLGVGNNADVLGLTAGLNIRPHSNVIFRPELRWGRDNDGRIVPGAHNQQLGFGMDAILTF